MLIVGDLNCAGRSSTLFRINYFAVLRAKTQNLFGMIKRSHGPRRQSVVTTGCPAVPQEHGAWSRAISIRGWCHKTRDIRKMSAAQFDLQFKPNCKKLCLAGISQTLKKAFLENKIEDSISQTKKKKITIWKQLQKFRDIQKGLLRKTGSVRGLLTMYHTKFWILLKWCEMHISSLIPSLTRYTHWCGTQVCAGKLWE